MKKLFVFILALVMALSMTSCGLFADNSKVVLSEAYTHQDPDGVNYDDRFVLKGEGFAELFEEYMNAAAYPDLFMLDEAGNIIGMYIYDETTGLATGYTSFADGGMIMYPEGEEVDLGKPDESMMIDIPGTVDMAAVVYGAGENVLDSYLYLLYSDASAKDMVISSAAACMGMEFTEEAEGVLKLVKSKEDILAELEMQAMYGLAYDVKDASAYADYLKNFFGLKIENAANPYVPYSGHTAPEGLEYDNVAVLTGAGSYAIPESCDGHLLCMTDYIYEKDGVVVAQYTYYEFDSKEYADKANAEQFAFNQTFVSDTVIMGSLVGEELDSVLTTYMGYGMIPDKSLVSYVEYLEMAFEAALYE